MTTTTELPQTNQETINLFQLGCLVNLHIRQWGGRKKITRQDLLNVGLDPQKLPPDICGLGRKLLVSKSELDVLTKLGQRARGCLEKWSMPFNAIGCHFVPIKFIPTIETQLEEIKNDYEKAVDSFIVRFADIKEKMEKDHPEFWEKCLKHCYPSSPELLREKYSLTWCKFKIAGTGVEGVSTEELMAQEEVKNERANELRSQMKEEVGDFVEEYVGTMRSETIKFCSLMTARINERPYGDEQDVKKLTGRSIEMFRRYVDRFKNMNIFGDTEVEKMLNEFKDNFLDPNVGTSDFDNARVKDSATKALSMIHKLASEEGETTSGFIGQLRRKIII